tara:strand:+ start:1896 stop:2477 length:582 start_codon:yes stop_codon:yes gene_type:complete
VSTDIGEQTMLFIDHLMPTQCGLRNPDLIERMMEHANKGGMFSMDVLQRYGGDVKIQVRQFEDKKLFLHDGHHRTLGIWLSGRDFLFPEEYDLTSFRYADYTSPNFEVGFVTPFDPREEVRHFEFHSFKHEARELAKVSVEQAMMFIEENRQRYSEKRSCWHVSQLANSLNRQRVEDKENESGIHQALQQEQD